jgi:hypothetical protein
VSFQLLNLYSAGRTVTFLYPIREESAVIRRHGSARVENAHLFQRAPVLASHLSISGRRSTLNLAFSLIVAIAASTLCRALAAIC